MNQQDSKTFSRAARIVFALAGIFLCANVFAQSQEPQVPDHYLFVFGTSAGMKNRVSATQMEINDLFSTGMGSALRQGDSIAVWTFGNKVGFNQFPLFAWQPEDAATVAKALNRFVSQQRYTGTNNYSELLLLLQRVAQSSPRLTVLIFCDGADPIVGTPYDDGINTVFKQHFAQQKKDRQPYIVVVRSQLGHLVGSSVNIPPGMVNLPEFPPFPKPEPQSQTITNAPPPPPPPPPAPLVVIGTHVERSWEAYQSAITNSPEKSAPQANSNTTQSNAASTGNSANVETNSSPAESNAPSAVKAPKNFVTNTETTSPPPPPKENPALANSVAATNQIALPPENSGAGGTIALALAAGFLLGALTLTVAFIFRSRRAGRGSLISESMKK